jgi:hypothetical protein
MHQQVKELSTKKKRIGRGSNCIEDKEGKMLFEDKEITKRWVEYVQELYNDEPGQPPVVLEQNEEVQIIRSEIEWAIKEFEE